MDGNGIRASVHRDGQCVLTMYVDGVDMSWVRYNIEELDGLVALLAEARKHMKGALS
jgi:hypothetical protein